MFVVMSGVYAIPERQIDLRAMEAWTRDVFAGRRVLEIAAGTCWWTPHGAALADSCWPRTSIRRRRRSLRQRRYRRASTKHSLTRTRSTVLKARYSMAPLLDPPRRGGQRVSTAFPQRRLSPHRAERLPVEGRSLRCCQPMGARSRMDPARALLDPLLPPAALMSQIVAIGC
jgi:hypothetical protein